MFLIFFGLGERSRKNLSYGGFLSCAVTTCGVITVPDTRLAWGIIRKLQLGPVLKASQSDGEVGRQFSRP